ncbi:MAG TPA: SPFH domain-containing protein [Candidatus Woesebacteria bacterium]|nr:SPFH domain-containing protein [Candidatus Woesebacteria bacterium]HPJ17105.1 SPFH domain-containing protein [Candidatus Woesebacteria bacterium]
MTFESIIFWIVLITVITALLKSFRIVKQYEKGIVVRLGKYSHTVDSGITLLTPFVDSIILVDMREKVMNVQPQKVITKDNVSVIVDAVIYYKVVDPVKAEFEIEDFDYAATTLAQTNLRNLIGDKSLDETLTARDSINTSLRQVLDESTNAWGVKVTKVELQKIDPPQDITDAMSQQMKAEREKRARILEAEGFRQSEILKAEGDAKSRLLRAEAEAKSVEMVAKAAESTFTDRAQKLRQFEVAEKVLGGESTKFVLPSNGELVNVLNLEGSGKIVPLKK